MFAFNKIINKNFLDILRFIRSKIKKNNTSNDSYKNKFIIKLIYSLVFFRFSFKRYKKYSNSLFEYKRYKNGLYFISKSIKNNNANVIFSLPRSGIHHLNRILLSYMEQIYSLGSGNFKIKNNKIKFNIKPNTYPSIRDISEAAITDELTFNDNLFSQTHYPSLVASAYGNILELSKIKGLILIRNPISALSSYIIKSTYKMFRSEEDILKKKKLINNSISSQIDKTIDKYLDYYFFWDNQIKNCNGKNFLIVKYEDLINNPKMQMILMLNFFNIKVNDTFLDKSIKQNDINLLRNRFESNGKELIAASIDVDIFNIRKAVEKKIKNILKEKNFSLFNYDFNKN